MTHNIPLPHGSLDRAIAIAVEAHAGQIDKAGAPYILHPLRVMLRQETNDARIVAVPHDVVEDSPDWTFERLRGEGFSETILQGIRAVTKLPEESGDDKSGYQAFIRRAAAHPIGRLVKIADMEDNCDLSRIASPTESDFRRLERYRRAIAVIESMKTS